MGVYDKYVLPKVINFACSMTPIMRQRGKVVPRARGRVLEIGMGAGQNIAYYDPAKVEMLYGLEPSDEMRALAADRVKAAKFKFEFIDLPGEEIPLGDNSVDTVVSTFTMCTIPDLEKALRGMRRVLRPDGQLLFCEHGLAPDANVAKWQNRADNIWGKFTGGCHLNRKISKMVEAAGFRLYGVETMYLPGTPRFMGYNYWGAASKG